MQALAVEEEDLLVLVGQEARQAAQTLRQSRELPLRALDVSLRGLLQALPPASQRLLSAGMQSRQRLQLP